MAPLCKGSWIAEGGTEGLFLPTGQTSGLEKPEVIADGKCPMFFLFYHRQGAYFMENFLNKFGINTRCENMPLYFERAKALFAEKGADILDFERYAIYTYMEPDIARIRDIIAEDGDSILYAYFLYAAI